MQRRDRREPVNHVDHVPELDAKPFPFVGYLNGDAFVGRRLALDHERTQFSEIAGRWLIADEGRAEAKEHLALVWTAPIQTRTAKDNGGEKASRPERLERLAPRIREANANRSADGARETVAGRVLGGDQDVRIFCALQFAAEPLDGGEIRWRARS